MVTRPELTVAAAVSRVKVCIIRFIICFVGFLSSLNSSLTYYHNSVYIVLVTIGLHTKQEARKISWTLSPSCRSQEDLAVASNAYYETECTMSIKQKYTLVCRSSAGTGWNSNFLIIENKAYCQNFTNGYEETHTLSIEGMFTSLIQ